MNSVKVIFTDSAKIKNEISEFDSNKVLETINVQIRDLIHFIKVPF